MACWYFKSASHTTTSAEGVCRGKRPSDSLEVIGLVKGSRGSNRRLLPTGCFLRHCSAYDTPCSGRRVLQSVRIDTLPEFNAHDTLGSRSCDRSRVKRHAAEPGREPGRPGFRVSEASVFSPHSSLVVCGGCSELLPGRPRLLSAGNQAFSLIAFVFREQLTHRGWIYSSEMQMFLAHDSNHWFLRQRTLLRDRKHILPLEPASPLTN